MSEPYKIDELYESLRFKVDKSHEENVFFRVWDSSTLICIGGFEKLYECEYSLEQCISDYSEFGLIEVTPVFEHIKKHIISGLSEGEQFDFFEDHHKELKELAQQYYDTIEIIQELATEYIEKHGLGK